MAQFPAKLWLCGAALLLVCGRVIADADALAAQQLENEATEALMDLTPETYDHTYTTEKAVLVQFTANWCSRCKSIKKEYVRASLLASRLGVPVTLARVDAGKHAEFARDMGVANLPTFYLYRNNAVPGLQLNESDRSRPMDFPLLTTAEAMVAGVGKLLGTHTELNPAKELVDEPLDVAQWLFWRGADDGRILTTLVLFAPPHVSGPAASAGAQLEAAFNDVAKDLMRFSNLRFAVARRPELFDFFEIPVDRATVVVYTDHDEGRGEYAGAPEAAALRDWMLRRDTPLVTTVWHRTLQSHRKRVPFLALFFLTQAQFETQSTVNHVRDALLEAALELERRGRIVRGEFTIGVADGEKYKSWLTALGLHEGQLPSIGLENTTSTAVWAGPDFVREALCTNAAEAQIVASAQSDQERYHVPDACPEEWVARVQQALPPKPAEVAVDADGNVKPSFEHDLKLAKLSWIDVPLHTVVEFLDAALSGALPSAPLKAASETSSAPERNATY